MGNKASSDAADEGEKKGPQSTPTDTDEDTSKDIEKLVKGLEDTYQAGTDFYSALFCLFCFYNNMLCLAWTMCVGVICFAVFLTFGIIYLITDADDCGTTSAKWIFCILSICTYSLSLLCGSYNPPVGHFMISIAFLIFATCVMFGPEQVCLGSSLHTWFLLHYIGLFLATAFLGYLFYLRADSFGTLWIPKKYQEAIDVANEVINGNTEENETLIDTEADITGLSDREKKSVNEKRKVTFTASSKTHDGLSSDNSKKEKQSGDCAQS